MKTITVSNTTLPKVAMNELGDASRWVEIAQDNGLLLPYIGAPTTLLIRDPSTPSTRGVPR